VWDKRGRKALTIGVRYKNRQWKPAVAYSRYADDFVVIIKGSKQQAEVIRDQCRNFLEGKLKLTLNMEKTHITHVNDGCVFLGHRIIQKRGPKGNIRVVSGIPKEKAKAFAHSLSELLSGDYSRSKIDKVDKLNQKLKGWSQFYQHTDFTAKVYSKIDRIAFWKLAHWLARKYRCSVKSLMMKWCKRPEPTQAKPWVLFSKTDNGNLCGKNLFRLVSRLKMPFRWRLPESNPYFRDEVRNTITFKYADVAMAVGRD
jgi:hypothetical protein